MTRKSLFEELNELAPIKDNMNLVESRGSHVIASAINLIEFIDRHYGEEEANHLCKRLMSSIKGRDPKRFARAVKKLPKEL